MRNYMINLKHESMDMNS